MEIPLFQFVPADSWPVTGHHQEEPGSIFFTPSYWVFIHIDKIPLSLLFCKLSRCSSPSLYSYNTCTSPLIALQPFSGLIPAYPYLCCIVETRTAPSTPDVSRQCWVEWKNHSPWSAGSALPNASEDAIGFHCCKEPLLDHSHLEGVLPKKNPTFPVQSTHHFEWKRFWPFDPLNNCSSRGEIILVLGKSWIMVGNLSEQSFTMWNYLCSSSSNLRQKNVFPC